MSKIKNFEDLQNLGTSSIHEHTHIARKQVEALLNKSFGEISRVQFMGFISILEREYGADFSDIRSEYDDYSRSNSNNVLQQSPILQAPSKTRSRWVLGAIASVLILVGLGFAIQKALGNAPKEEVIVLNSANVDVISEPIDANLSSDINESEANLSVETSEQNMTSPENKMQAIGSAVTIRPVYKVWVGMLDLSSGMKTQKITKEPIVVDTTKNWLFVFGHGRLEIETPDANQTLREKNTVRFSYENGKLERLSNEEFRAKNSGVNW